MKMGFHKAWTFAYEHTGKRATTKSWDTAENAELALDVMKTESRGDERRLSHHLVVVELDVDSWGSMPGDVIA
jgi:hypothetical protein